MYGPVVRSRHPADIYRALSQLRTGGGGDEAEVSNGDLVTTTKLGEHHVQKQITVYVDHPYVQFDI